MLVFAFFQRGIIKMTAPLFQRRDFGVCPFPEGDVNVCPFPEGIVKMTAISS
jgi:hypothetical protein